MKQYDSSELMDIHSLAECDLDWSCTAIEDIKKGLKDIQKYVENEGKISNYNFSFLLEKISMYEYILENRRGYHGTQKEAFKKEMGE